MFLLGTKIDAWLIDYFGAIAGAWLKIGFDSRLGTRVGTCGLLGLVYTGIVICLGTRLDAWLIASLALGMVLDFEYGLDKRLGT